MDAGVVEVPQLRPLVLGVPAVLVVAEREMRSLARDFSSSRRAPPMAASNFHLSSACFRPWVFITSVCTAAPCSIGLMSRATPSGLVQAGPRRSRRHGGRGRRSSRGTSSACPRAAAGSAVAGAKALSSRCSSTELSLPTEYSITGLANEAATSRRMWMLSASSRSRWDSVRGCGMAVIGWERGRRAPEAVHARHHSPEGPPVFPPGLVRRK
jgi:hypothetical protein